MVKNLSPKSILDDVWPIGIIHGFGGQWYTVSLPVTSLGKFVLIYLENIGLCFLRGSVSLRGHTKGTIKPKAIDACFLWASFANKAAGTGVVYHDN